MYQAEYGAKYKKKYKELGVFGSKKGNRTLQSIRYRNRYPEKVRAYYLLNYAKKKGIVTQKRICEFCGSNEKTMAHHNNYNEPLVVVWLCPKCHNRVHALLY